MGPRIRANRERSTRGDEEWDDGRVPDPDTSTDPQPPVVDGGAADAPVMRHPDRVRGRRPRPVVAVLACLGVGFGAGVATAEVWDGPGGPVPTASAPVVSAALAGDGTGQVPDRAPDAVSRSEEARAVLGTPDAPGATDAPGPVALPTPPPPGTLAPLAPLASSPTPPVRVPAAPEVPPTPTPLVPTASAVPVPEPGSGLTGKDVVPDLGGTLVVVPGEVPAPGPGTVRSVRVEAELGLPLDGDVLAEAVLATLNDPRGWGATDGVTFSRTAADDASIRVVLASPATTDRMCAPLQTEGRYSCGNSLTGVAVLNFDRWVHGAADFGDDVATYRQYLVNHEVGHVLGHGHEPCPAPGAVAPVMVQQSISTEGCVPNGWPSP